MNYHLIDANDLKSASLIKENNLIAKNLSIINKCIQTKYQSIDVLDFTNKTIIIPIEGNETILYKVIQILEDNNHICQIQTTDDTNYISNSTHIFQLKISYNSACLIEGIRQSKSINNYVYKAITNINTVIKRHHISKFYIASYIIPIYIINDGYDDDRNPIHIILSTPNADIIAHHILQILEKKNYIVNMENTGLLYNFNIMWNY